MNALSFRSAPAAPSLMATSHRHARRRWSILPPTKRAPPWKRLLFREVTGAQRTQATRSWRATTRMLAQGGRRGRLVFVPPGTRDHVRAYDKQLQLHQCFWTVILNSQTMCTSHLYVALVPACVCACYNTLIQTVVCATTTILRRLLMSVRSAQAQDGGGCWPPLSLQRLLPWSCWD